jgi:hypothetical protein
LLHFLALPGDWQKHLGHVTMLFEMLCGLSNFELQCDWLKNLWIAAIACFELYSG